MPIDFSSVYYTYSPKTPLEFEALKGINLHIENGEFLALVGRTGCGKSTLVSHINALLTPSKGEVRVDEFVSCSDKKRRSKKISPLRKKVGLVFQFPEYQLFEKTVLDDVAFGPKNFGKSKEEAIEDAKVALSLVGLGERFYDRSPFELSGGEKRRAAIAGILAIKPDYLVVDEPTAGLDPLGAKEMMDLFDEIHSKGTTLILVTHDMSLVLKHCSRVVVMKDGQIARVCAPLELFREDLSAYSLQIPPFYGFAKELREKGLPIDLDKCLDVESLAQEIIRVKGAKNG